MQQPNETPQVVLYGDSVGCSYRMKIRYNSYANLLARRLNKDVALDYISGANSSLVLQFLTTDEVKIGHLRGSEIVILSVGGNNILVPFLMAMVRALDLGPLGAKTMKQIGMKFKTDKLAAVKVLKELLGQKTKEDATAGVELFRKEFPAIIEKMKEINPDAVILVHNVYNPFNTVRSKVYRELGKPMGKYMDMINEILAEDAPKLGFLLADVENAFKTYKGGEDLTYIKDKDMHLTDFGHIYIYRCLYETLIKACPQYACEEAPGVIKRMEDLTEEEIRFQAEAEALTKARIDGGDSDAIVQPDDFSAGEYQKYNEWFTGEADGMKFYPLKKAAIEVENAQAAKSLEAGQTLFFKMEDGILVVYGQDGIKIGGVTGETADDSAPSIAVAMEKNFLNTVKVLSTGTIPEILYAIYPSYEYYAETVKAKKQKSAQLETSKA